MKVIITGATGMVGEGVLHECLHHPDVEKLLIVTRKPTGLSHFKLKEIVHQNFHDLSPIENGFAGYDACFFCLGVSSMGMKEQQYHHLTYDLTLHFAKTMLKWNPSSSFCYVSGAGTDSSEKGSMWARVKGKTENHLVQLPFKSAYMFRPAFIQPTKGLKNTLGFYKYVSWMFPVLQRFFPKYTCTLQQIGQAMINAVKYGYTKTILEATDIVILSKRLS